MKDALRIIVDRNYEKKTYNIFSVYRDLQFIPDRDVGLWLLK